MFYAESLCLREFGRSLTDDQSLRGCGRKIRRGVVGAADEILETTVFCGQAWLCPVCGYQAACDQSRQLANIFTVWKSQGGSVGLLTLSQSHSTDDELDVLWDRADEGWAVMVRGSGWRADRDMFGLRGYIRVTEVVHSPESGWNVHFHVPLLLDAPLDDDQLNELKDRVSARFMRGVRAAGGAATGDGQHLSVIQPRSETRLITYYAKGTTARWTPDGSRTPMAILADLNETGEGLGLWKEFTAVVTGTKRRRYSPSHGIANLVPNRL
ncbi:hypothetical protein MINTM020_44760 [Mycobacterium paraintracellulare]|uniref:protein rep n=1 Tax=Mycobacterium paraintracellulare TaxID=1138383 RepID=UPI001928C9F8|nr:protein rep [Mycobacterium paraintracellulare]BCP12378.1 hypothetical protein MINTM020_44760 [Mycobacterium paraintracellulare]